MADGEGAGQGAGAAAVAGDGAGAGAGGGGDQGAGAGAPPEWLGSLPDELKGDATLTRYKSVEELARGHLDTQRLARSKLSIPAADAAPEVWGAVFDQLGRPKDAAEYKVPLPEGLTESPLADAFKPIAHGLGLLPGQVEGVAKFFNEQTAAADAAYFAQGKEEVEALKAELGADYEPMVAAAKAAFGKFFDPTDADMLDRIMGSGKLVKGFVALAKATGEHGRVDGDGAGGFGAGDANAAQQIMKLQADDGWREKFNKGDAATVAQYERLLKAAKAQAVAGA